MTQASLVQPRAIAANTAEPFSAESLGAHVLASAVSIAAPSNSMSGEVSIVIPSVATIGHPSWLTVCRASRAGPAFHERGRRPFVGIGRNPVIFVIAATWPYA
jgi:hypothetical protein